MLRANEDLLIGAMDTVGKDLLLGDFAFGNHDLEVIAQIIALQTWGTILILSLTSI